MGSHCCCEVGASDADRKQDIVPTTDDAARPLTVALRCVDMARWMIWRGARALAEMSRVPGDIYRDWNRLRNLDLDRDLCAFVARDGVSNVVVIACCENPRRCLFQSFHATARLPGRKEIAPWKHRRTIIRAMVR